MVVSWCNLVFFGLVLLFAGCRSAEPDTSVLLLEDRLIVYEPSEEYILGRTSNGLYLVRTSFVKQALWDAQKVQELEERLREAEIKD